jgi:hypothetical protein
VTISTILLVAGGACALVGLWLVAKHFAKRPARHARAIRMDAARPATTSPEGSNLGVALMCAGAALFLTGAYQLV